MQHRVNFQKEGGNGGNAQEQMNGNLGTMFAQWSCPEEGKNWAKKSVPVVTLLISLLMAMGMHYTVKVHTVQM